MERKPHKHNEIHYTYKQYVFTNGNANTLIILGEVEYTTNAPKTTDV